MYQLAFCHCDKILEKKIRFILERFILAHGFRGFCPLALGPIAGTCGEAEHHGDEYMVKQNGSPHGRRKQREREEGARVSISPSRAHPQ